MLAPAPAPEARLWTPEGFREDDWRHAESADVLASNGRFILTLQVFLALEPEQRRLRKERIGVLLAPGEMIDAIVPHLDDLALIALVFPAFTDGRSFSKAELLRSRHHFEGPIRAVGQVLIDQLPHMLRLGFDEFEVTHPVLIERLERGETGGIPFYNQPTAKPAEKTPGYSWRRTRSD